MTNRLKEICSRLIVYSGLDELESKECVDNAFRTHNDVDDVDEQIRSIKSNYNRQERHIFDKELKKERSEKSVKESSRKQKKNARLLLKLEKRLKTSNAIDVKPRIIPEHIWKQTTHIIADSSGWAARYYSSHCKHRIALSLIHRAALSYDDIGKPRYQYNGDSCESLRARRTLALGLMLILLSRKTGRHGQGWNLIVKGIPQSCFVAALRDPWTGQRPHSNTINGTHQKSNEFETDGSVGYLKALKNVGFCYTRQARWRDGANPKNIKGFADLMPNELASKVHPSGWRTSLVRYWIVSSEFLDAKSIDKRTKLMIAWIAGNQPFPLDTTDTVGQSEEKCIDTEVHAQSPPSPS